MTNFSAVKNKRRPHRPNRKDAAPRRQSRKSQERYDQALEDNGFEFTDFNKVSYTWDGDFPVFHLAPGVCNETLIRGFIARCGDFEIVFPYGTPPPEMAKRLNDEIIKIVRLQAEAAEVPLDWRPEDEIDLIDFDEFMTSGKNGLNLVANGQNIKAHKTDTALWVTVKDGVKVKEAWLPLPRYEDRPTVKKLAEKCGINISDAVDIYHDRS